MKTILNLLLMALALSANVATAQQIPTLSFDVLANDKVLWSGEFSGDTRSSRNLVVAGEPTLLVSLSSHETGCYGLFFGEEIIEGFVEHKSAGGSISLPSFNRSGWCLHGVHRSQLIGQIIDVGVLAGAKSRAHYRVTFQERTPKHPKAQPWHGHNSNLIPDVESAARAAFEFMKQVSPGSFEEKDLEDWLSE